MKQFALIFFILFFFLAGDLYAEDWPRFSPGEEVTFKIRIKNTSLEFLPKVSVVNHLPPFAQILLADATVYELALGPGEEKEVNIRAKIVANGLDQTQCEAYSVLVAGAGEKKEKSVPLCLAESTKVDLLPKTGGSGEVFLGLSLFLVIVSLALRFLVLAVYLKA